MKRWILNKLLRHLFNVITEDDFLIFKDGHLYLGKLPLNADAVEEVKSQAKLIRNLKLWQLLTGEMTHGAQDLMFNKAIKDADLVGGKWMLYTLDVMERKLVNLADLK